MNELTKNIFFSKNHAMNNPLIKRITLKEFEHAILQSLPPIEQKKFQSFFTSFYTANFFLPHFGEVKIISKKIGQKFTFQVFEVNPTENTYLDVTAIKSIVGFSFYVQGHTEGLLADLNIKIPVIKDTGIICVSNYGRSILKLKKGQPFTNINLFIPSQDFVDFMGESIHTLPITFQEALYNSNQYYGTGGPTQPQINQLLLDLSQDNFSGPSANFLRESAALKIMGIQLAELIYNNETNPSKDIEKLHLAHTIVKNSLVNPPKVRELAQQVGLSEVKLKTGFKKLYNTSVYAFLIDCRMKKAIELLTQEHYSVKETAYSVGYATPNAFSHAFYKKYGLYPTDFIKKGLIPMPQHKKNWVK